VEDSHVDGCVWHKTVEGGGEGVQCQYIQVYD